MFRLLSYTVAVREVMIADEYMASGAVSGGDSTMRLSVGSIQASVALIQKCRVYDCGTVC